MRKNPSDMCAHLVIRSDDLEKYKLIIIVIMILLSKLLDY